MSLGNPSFFATGNITPMRFVEISNPYYVRQCATANLKTFGVSQMGTRNAPGTDADDGYCAKTGEGLQVFGEGEVTLLELGATVSAGNRLATDSSGKGAVATTGQNVGAIALDNGVSGDKIRVYVYLGNQTA